eukprot:m.230447 g.230447  ORF g.230447 m.230447 type:complete len:96 (-) comp13892_c0_seq12:122-409(-)
MLIHSRVDYFCMFCCFLFVFGGRRPEYSKMKQKKEAPSLPPRVYRESMPQTKAEFLVDKLNIENGSIRAHGQRKSSTTSGWTFIDPNVLKKAAKE